MADLLPLFQSLIGASGAFCVAAFTVYQSNKHQLRREGEQAARTARAERRKFLLERLEAAIVSVNSLADSLDNDGKILGDWFIAFKAKPDLKLNYERPSITEQLDKLYVHTHLYYPEFGAIVASLKEWDRESGAYLFDAWCQISAAQRHAEKVDDIAILLGHAKISMKYSALRSSALQKGRALLHSD